MSQVCSTYRKTPYCLAISHATLYHLYSRLHRHSYQVRKGLQGRLGTQMTSYGVLVRAQGMSGHSCFGSKKDPGQVRKRTHGRSGRGLRERHCLHDFPDNTLDPGRGVVGKGAGTEEDSRCGLPWHTPRNSPTQTKGVLFKARCLGHSCYGNSSTSSRVLKDTEELRTRIEALDNKLPYSTRRALPPSARQQHKHRGTAPNGPLVIRGGRACNKINNGYP